MAPSTAARSRQPKNALDREEALALRAAELSAWAQRNVRLIIAIAAVALVVGGGLVVWRYSEAQRSSAAAERLLALRQNPATATGAGTRELEAFVQQYGGTREADEARLMLADARLRSGEPREAAAALEPLAGSRSPLAAQASMMLGSAYAEAGDHAAAVRAFERAAEQADAKFQRIEALGQAALAHEQAGDHAAAVGVYERMLGEAGDEESMRYGVVQMRLTEARARAGGS
jgi:predicted negative regulator of RcsB-dependent stress response